MLYKLYIICVYIKICGRRCFKNERKENISYIESEWLDKMKMYLGFVTVQGLLGDGGFFYYFFCKSVRGKPLVNSCIAIFFLFFFFFGFLQQTVIKENIWVLLLTTLYIFYYIKGLQNFGSGKSRLKFYGVFFHNKYLY